MPNITMLADSLNSFLAKQGLPKLAESPSDMESLYEAALVSIWTIADKDKREELAMSIGQALAKYYGGKPVEDALKRIMPRMEQNEAAQAKADEKKAAEERKKDSNYVPSFEELMGS
jgi:hypothetical protein